RTRRIQDQNGDNPNDIDATERNAEGWRIVEKKNGHIAHAETLPEPDVNSDPMDNVQMDNIVKERYSPENMIPLLL
ncbi:MAG TPA: hypothetical protein VLK23_13585, partial [Thermodesulfobacteriota bacterium]|nr:hypothetical protein [Thermodesulfobacteriota bacterium]